MSAQDLLTRVETMRAGLPEGTGDELVTTVFEDAARISRETISSETGMSRPVLDQVLDRVLTHPVWGFVAMGALFFGVFWFTIVGAAWPSDALYTLLADRGHGWLRAGSEAIGAPWWVTGLLVDGVYLATAWVIAVMLPPMAIFFPLFALLEDFGYLPRVAFNLDRIYSRAGAHGKQSLSMMMGFGCNAAGVTATRIIDSPRERLIAIITNNFSVCNGRWPTLILMGTIFIGATAPPAVAGLVAAGSVVLVAVLGIITTFLVSWVLSRTVLRGEASLYSLELPPYRPPRLWQTIWTSLIERTLKVLWRAVIMAGPAGAVIWLLSNVTIGPESVAALMVGWFDPVGWLLGLNGVILLAYLVAIPANEIVIPTVLMLTVTLGAGHGAGTLPGVMADLPDVEATRILVDVGGWTLLTAVCLMLFSLLHNPCSTTVLTIWHETRSLRWTVVATLGPLLLAGVVTALVAVGWRSVASF